MACLLRFLEAGRTGSVTYHVKDGRVMEVEVKERMRM